MLESLFNSEYCGIFKSAYIEEYLQTAASENVGFFNIIIRNKFMMAYQKNGTQDPERTQDPMRTQDSMRTQDPVRT